MRIYKREEFLKLPEGTIYAKGKKWELRTLVPDYLFSSTSALAFFLRSRGGLTFDSGR